MKSLYRFKRIDEAKTFLKKSFPSNSPSKNFWDDTQFCKTSENTFSHVLQNCVSYIKVFWKGVWGKAFYSIKGLPHLKRYGMVLGISLVLVGCKREPNKEPIAASMPSAEEQEIAALSEKLDSLELMNVGVTAQEEGNWFYAFQCYAKVAKLYPNSEMAAQAHYLMGKIMVLRNQFTDAFDEFDIIIKDYPGFEKYNQVIADQFDVAVRLMQGERPYYWGLIPGFRDYGKALEFFDRVVENAPYGEYAAKALFYKAKLANDRDRPADAIIALDRLIADYKSSPLLADAYLLLANTYASLNKGAEYDQRTTQKAIDIYEDFMRVFPQDEKLAFAEERIAELKDLLAKGKLFLGDFYYYRRNNFQAARIFYNEAISVAPESKSARKAREVLDRIDAGVEAPTHWVEIITGRPKRITDEEYIDYAKLEHLEDEQYQLESYSLQVEPGADLGSPTIAPFSLTDNDPKYIEPVK